jgi:hypothetical protein
VSTRWGRHTGRGHPVQLRGALSLGALPPRAPLAAVEETLPAGWRFQGATTPAPEVTPRPGATGSLGSAWIKLPPGWPVTLIYRVSVPAVATGAGSPSGKASYSDEHETIAVAFRQVPDDRAGDHL